MVSGRKPNLERRRQVIELRELLTHYFRHQGSAGGLVHNVQDHAEHITDSAAASTQDSTSSTIPDHK